MRQNLNEILFQAKFEPTCNLLDILLALVLLDVTNRMV